MAGSPALFIGLMSGTSLDGVDAVLVDLGGHRAQVLAHSALPFPPELRAELLALNTPGANELQRAWLAGNALARVYAQAVDDVLVQAGVSAHQVTAIGAHGQTVRHRPQAFDGTGFTIQLNQPALLAELTGIAVVADFRSRDVAAGGQGAPLVPPFHRAFFADVAPQVGVLNIGGIANITLIDALASPGLRGFDCGPGNALLDAWCQQHTGAAFDASGAWGASGEVLPALLQRLLAEPFFARQPPKSTGRDLFHPAWLQQHLNADSRVAPQDVQATLTELSARTCADSVLRFAPGLGHLMVCGGGAYNDLLMRRLRALLPNCQVQTTDAWGLPPLQVEACAFAWLAQQALAGRAGNDPLVTGARGARVLGAVYPA